MAPSLHPRQTRIIGAADVDPRDVTGPLEVVSVSHVDVDLRKGCHCVSIDGGLDVDLAVEVGQALRTALAGATGVIIDLDDVTLLDPDAIEVLVRDIATVVPDAAVCFSASRLSARLVLGRWGVAHAYAVFGSVADALQTRLLADDGYGPGWTIGAPGTSPLR